MNVIITNLSTPKSGEPQKYHSDKGDFWGVNTNEAPIQYLLSCLKEQNTENKIRIIAITTPEAEDTFNVIRKTALNFAQQEHMQLDEKEIKKVSNTKFNQTIREIISLVNSDDKVYLDTTGGRRNAVYFLMTLVRILEYSKVTLEKAVYSNFSEKEELRRVEDITPDYQRLNLINAAELFTSLGNSAGLQEFFKEKENPEIDNVIDAMNEFSEAVALCRTSELDKILERLNGTLTELDSMTPTTENEILFQSISGVIREKFGIHEDGHKTIDYVDMIRWCLENKQIQQAVTIYTEKMGEYLYKNHYFTVSDEEKQRIKDKKDTFEFHYRLFYSDGLMSLMPACASSKTPFGRFLKKVKKEEPRIFDSLVNAKSYDAFLKMEPTLSLDEYEARGLKNFFRLKKIMYDGYGKRNKYDEIQIRLKAYPEFLKVAKDISAKDVEGFVNSVHNTENACSVLQGNYENKNFVYENHHINTIEYLTEALAEQKNYEICVQPEKMQQIMRDYLYIKNYLRNVFNHAGDHEDIPLEDKKYYKDSGYPDEDHLTLEKVTHLLIEALNHLQK